MDVLTSIETNMITILHTCNNKTHTHIYQFSTYSYTIYSIHVLYGPCLLSNQTLYCRRGPELRTVGVYSCNRVEVINI